MISLEKIRDLALALGADAVGVAPSAPVESEAKYREWLGKGFIGDMKYLARNLDLRFDPGKLLPGAKAVIVIGLNYFPSEKDRELLISPFKVAQYAWGIDYHHTTRKILKKLRRELKNEDPDLMGRICVDTAPFMDKYWAQKAGLGWQGKHTNLVSRQFGSWLVLGSLVINRDVDRYGTPYLDHCGNCRACVDACPTEAIFSEYNLDAARCISYWTIESKEDKIPGHIAANMQDWVFGCDICISVCPFNKFQKPYSIQAFQRMESVALVEKGAVTKLSENQFQESYARSPILRPGLTGIKRNLKAAKKMTKSLKKPEPDATGG